MAEYIHPIPPPPPLTVEELIISKAEEVGFDSELALKIAWCESGYKADAKNPSSSASGVFQFINSTWSAYCMGDKFNAEDNVTCALDMLADGGIGHWDASISCWSKL